MNGVVISLKKVYNLFYISIVWEKIDIKKKKRVNCIIDFNIMQEVKGLKKITFVMLGITLFLFLGLNIVTDPIVANTVDKQDDGRDVYLNIMTTNKMQYNVVKKIVGDKHNVEFMFKTPEEAKEFIYTDETVSNISNMDLFIYSDDKFEPWSKDLINQLEKGKLGIINISRGIKKITTQNGTESVDNPYYWTGLDEYKIMLYNVKNAIQDRDPKNRYVYEENYNDAVSQIENEIKSIKDTKDSINQYVFVSLDHDLDYFYRTLGISTINVSETDSLDKVVKSIDLQDKSIVIVKDKDVDTLHDLTNYNMVIELSKSNINGSIEDLILDNYKTFYDSI